MNKEFAEALAEKLLDIYDIGDYVTDGYEPYFKEESEKTLSAVIQRAAKEIQETALQELVDQAQELNLGYEDEILD